MAKKINIGEQELKKKAAKISIMEGSAYSVMEGFGLQYITPYAIALGMSNTFIGWLSSLPGLIGNLAQIPGSKIIEKVSRKKIVITGVLLQMFMWLPLLAVGLLAFFFKIPLLATSILLILFYTLLVMFGAFAGPAWSSWMKELIEKNTDYYFAKRSMVAGIVGLICTSLAGVFLDYFTKFNFLIGFGVIFSMALIGRGLSAYLFTKQYEPKFQKVEGYYFSFFEFIKKMRYNNFGKFVMMLSAVSFAVAVASPFFAVYMLKDLGFSYTSYMAAVTGSIILTLLSVPLWGKFGDKYGNIKILKLCGTFIFIVPFLWMAITLIKMNNASLVLPYVIAIEAFSGFVWAGFNLSSGTFVYHAVTRQRLALCVAYSSILNSAGAFIGATLGGAIASYSGNILGLKPLLFVFGLSAVLRFLAIVIFLPRIKEVREVKKFSFEDEFKKFVPKWPKHLFGNGTKREGFNVPVSH